MRARNNGMWVWVGVAVVVIIAIGSGIYWYLQKEGVAQGPVPVDAPAGQLVQGFPQQLAPVQIASTTASSSNASNVLAGLIGSYAVSYSSSTHQYTAQWNSSSTLATLYAGYSAYAAAQGLTIINSLNTPSLAILYAANASFSVNIAIAPLGARGEGSHITVTYLDAASAH